MKRLLSFIGGAALLLLVAALAAGPERRRAACIASGLCERTDFLGAMLISVQRQQKLVVLTARLVVPVSSARDTTIGPITIATTRQTDIVPASVNYVVDLSQLKAADLTWDEQTQTLSLRRPPVRPLLPIAPDWAAAQTYTDDGWATVVTDVAANLKRDNETKAPGMFAAQAQGRDLVAMANTAADAALETTFRMPLVAAGFSNAKVVVTSE
jgi:hypothetical protein